MEVSGTERWGRWGPFNFLTCNSIFVLALQYLRPTDSGMGHSRTEPPYVPLLRNAEPSLSRCDVLVI